MPGEKESQCPHLRYDGSHEFHGERRECYRCLLLAQMLFYPEDQAPTHIVADCVRHCGVRLGAAPDADPWFKDELDEARRMTIAFGHAWASHRLLPDGHEKNVEEYSKTHLRGETRSAILEGVRYGLPMARAQELIDQYATLATGGK